MISIQPTPYPFKAMLAVCSDLDETADANTYFDTVRYLNTREDTKHGPGIGLEVGNTLYFDMPKEQFSYYNTDGLDRRRLHQLIHSGHIDCIHSFGDLTRDRSRVEEILTELTSHNSYLQVWIDHAIAPTNLDTDIMQGQGNLPGAPAYHADLISTYGVRYVWLGRVSSVIGQDTKRRLGGIWSSHCPFRSLITLGKEALKGILPYLGKPKYQMHVSNRLLRPGRLADGSEVWEFLRCNPSPWGVSMHETGDGFGKVMTDGFLNLLVKRKGKSIVYTHLGKLRNPDSTFTGETARAWARLKTYQDRQQVLVCTTRRLLDYTLMTETVSLNCETSGKGLRINVDNPKHLPLDGLSLVMPQTSTVELCENNQSYSQFNTIQQGSTTLIHIPWSPLTFPKLTDD